MGDMNDVITGRSAMRRARPLFLWINAWRRRNEEESKPGIKPGRDRGAHSNEEIILGGGETLFFWEEAGLILHWKLNQSDHNL